jgi:hypothetical protein
MSDVATFRFDRRNKRLFLYGSNADSDLEIIKKLLYEGKLKPDLNAIIYQKERTSSLSYIIRGKFLEEFLSNIQKNGKTSVSDFQTTLAQVNASSELESSYTSLVVYCLDTKKFLMVMPKNSMSWTLMGSHPYNPEETSMDIICRVGPQYDLPITVEAFTSNSVLKLDIIKDSPTTYNNYLVFVQSEYTPAFPDNISKIKWLNITDKVSLSSYCRKLFNTDAYIKKLIHSSGQDIDFDTIIEEILSNNVPSDDDPPPQVA